MLTFAFVSFVITSFIIVASVFKSVAFKTFSIELIQPDNTLVLGYLGAAFTSYVMRRNAKDKLDKAKEEENRSV